MTHETPSVGSALLDALLDAALVDAFFITDAEGTILRVNPAAGRMFGRDVAAMIGQNVTILMPEPVRNQHDGFLGHHISTGMTKVLGMGRELEGQRADGTRFPFYASVGRADVDGKVLFVALMHDISVRKRTEAALERSQRMEAVGRLTGGVAHDFNNLLTIIGGNLELLEARLDDPAQRELVQDAVAATDLASNLTGQLLAFARRSLLSPARLDVNADVDQVVGLLRHTISPRISLHTVLMPDIWPVMADPAQLQTALLNLAINAQDAMPDGGQLVFETANATIDDRYMAQEVDIQTGRYVRISVTDTGTGMSGETAGRAFEPFFTTKPVGKGTGLGLAMVYGFIRQSGGHTTIYSEPGQGTTINLYLPVADQGVAADLNISAAPAEPQGAGQTVLVVEDDPALRRLALTRLEALGYRGVPAEDAAEALRVLCEPRKIDLLFTDLIMPGAMSGYDLACHIRTTRPEIAILLTSGYAEDVVHADVLAKSGFPLLRKPYRQTDLAALLGLLLQQKHE